MSWLVSQVTDRSISICSAPEWVVLQSMSGFPRRACALRCLSQNFHSLSPGTSGGDRLGRRQGLLLGSTKGRLVADRKQPQRLSWVEVVLYPSAPTQITLNFKPVWLQKARPTTTSAGVIWHWHEQLHFAATSTPSAAARDDGIISRAEKEDTLDKQKNRR